MIEFCTVDMKYEYVVMDLSKIQTPDIRLRMLNEISSDSGLFK